MATTSLGLNLARLIIQETHVYQQTLFFVVPGDCFAVLACFAIVAVAGVGRMCCISANCSRPNPFSARLWSNVERVPGYTPYLSRCWPRMLRR
jgi:hypothetical protein